MAAKQGAVSRLIKILNERDKKGPVEPSKPLEEYKGGKMPTPTGKSNEFSYPGGLGEYLKEAQKRGLDISDVKSAADLQSKIYDNLMSSEGGKAIIKNMWKGYGDTLKGSGKVLPENISDNDLANLKSSFVDDKLGARTQMILEQMNPEVPQRAMPPKPSAPQQREYRGEPVYLPGVKGLTGGTITNALVGFLSDNAEFEPIEESDYGRFAVPKWAQESLAAGGADEYLKTKLGGYYKGRKKSSTKK